MRDAFFLALFCLTLIKNEKKENMVKNENIFSNVYNAGVAQLLYDPLQVMR
jgi:hypothetical protein